MKKLVLAVMLGLMATGGPAGAFSLPKLFQGGSQSAVEQPRADNPPVVLAQANEAVRVQQLQEEIRQLNGRIEEMSFQLLQMQEQLRKTQEDNEFRFQDLEKKKRSEADTTAGGPAVASNRAPPAQAAPPAQSSDDVARIIGSPADSDIGQQQGGDSRTAPPPTTLGSIDFDQNGNPRAATRNDRSNSAALPGVDTGPALPGKTATPGRTDPQQTASLGNENDAYQIAYNHVLSGDYTLAEKEFLAYIQAYPKGGRIADANFWLGEAQYSQEKYNEAAKTFLNAHQNYGKSAKAPEMLLKLGMSLAALDNTETACATLREVPKRYPSASKAVLAKVGSEQKRLRCS
ncbi:tol-pal system protein YbgF [Neorhizobium sp. R1-B]|uniref:tol-pal system protein YbgF n=1 Tax=Neorhizobium TaxID=1525371 RepID=UPI000CF8FA18|nr:MULTISPECIES: tol-pal system protein YbgF [Neorhizobium]TCV74716.1 tol-pal system protein YbgF [Neorhizobium sp. S3-V5DH]TDX71774.1 tol-pal system protein YbgF [Neorhizobium sp. R1-B]